MPKVRVCHKDLIFSLVYGSSLTDPHPPPKNKTKQNLTVVHLLVPAPFIYGTA